MAGNRVPKVREEDWVSVQKAIRRLNAAASGDTNVTYRIINISSGGVINLPEESGGITGSAFEVVADATARLALTPFVSRTCYQSDEGTFWGFTTL
jgi:hypothetical protein